MTRFVGLAVLGLSLVAQSHAYHEPETTIVKKPQYHFGTSFPMIGTQPVPEYTWDGEIWAGTDLKFNPGWTFSYTNSYYVPQLHDHGEKDDGKDDTYPGDEDDGHNHPPTPHPGVGESCGKLYGPHCKHMLYCSVDPGYNPYQTGTCKPISATGGMGTEGWYPGSTENPYINVGNSHSNGVNNMLSGSHMGDNLNSWTGGSSTNVGTGEASCQNACGFQAVNGQCWCDSQCKNTGDCCPDIQTYCSSEYASVAYKPPTPATVVQPAPTPAPYVQGGDLNSMTNLESWTGWYQSQNTAPPTIFVPPITFPAGGNNPGGVATMPSTPNAFSATASCQNKCGQEVKTTTGVCWCDTGCQKYGDCCTDRLTHCNV